MGFAPGQVKEANEKCISLPSRIVGKTINPDFGGNPACKKTFGQVRGKVSDFLDLESKTTKQMVVIGGGVVVGLWLLNKGLSLAKYLAIGTVGYLAYKEYKKRQKERMRLGSERAQYEAMKSMEQ